MTSADRAFALDIDKDGEVCVAGDYQVIGPPVNHLNAYVGKMDAAASNWIYLSFLGSEGGDDTARGVVADPLGRPFVLGYTTAVDFYTTAGAFDRTYNGGYSDVFVAKFFHSGVPQFVTLVGGNNWDFCEGGIALDPSGDIVICGTTDSADFPTTPAAFDRNTNGSYDAFIAKLDPQLRWLSYSTFVGGGSVDYGEDVAIDADGNPYLTGQTWSGDFPVTPNAYDSSHNSSGDAFLAKANPHGSNLLFSSYLGGANEDGGRAVGASGENEAVIAGMANSSGFPTSEWAFDETYNGSGDGFVTKFSVSHSPQPPVRQTFGAGDFINNGFNGLAVDFGGLGLWLWAGLGWANLSGVNPKGLLAADIDGVTDDEIIGDFEGLGLWLWDSWNWTQLSGVNPEHLVASNFDADADAEILADFGALGVWQYNGGAWSHISNINPEWLVAANLDADLVAEAVVDFGLTGVWMWDGGNWTQARQQRHRFHDRREPGCRLDPGDRRGFRRSRLMAMGWRRTGPSNWTRGTPNTCLRPIRITTASTSCTSISGRMGSGLGTGEAGHSARQPTLGT